VEKGKIVSLEERIPKLKQQRRKKANRRLILLLLLFFSLIIFVVYFQSPISHVNKIKVKGNIVYSSDELIAISDLTNETNIWNVDKSEIERKLKKLTELKSAEVQTIFPNIVEIKVTEYKRIAYIMKEKSYLPVIENGKTLKSAEVSEIPSNAPILIGFSEGNALNGMIEELGSLHEEVLNSISEIHYTPKETDSLHLTIFMNDGFEVSATIRGFADKMVHYPSIVSQLDPNKKGIIDLEVGSFFKAYEKEGAEEDEKENESDR